MLYYFDLATTYLKCLDHVMMAASSSVPSEVREEDDHCGSFRVLYAASWLNVTNKACFVTCVTVGVILAVLM